MGGKTQHRIQESVAGLLLDVVEQFLDFGNGQKQAGPYFLGFGTRCDPAEDFGSGHKGGLFVCFGES